MRPIGGATPIRCRRWECSTRTTRRGSGGRDRGRPAVQSHAGAFVPVELDAAVTAGVKALSQRQGTTVFMTLVAAWATVLSRLAGQSEVVIGTPTANRGRRELEGLIGFFVNTLALRVDVSGAPTVAELLGRVKAQVVGAQQHQDVPFEQVVELVQPGRSLAHTPLFQVMFGWQNIPRARLALPDLTFSAVGETSHATSKVDLTLFLWETGESSERIVGGIEYATALFDRATVERYAGYVERVLAAMVADPTQRVDAVPLLAAAERQQVVAEWNATDAPYPETACVHELVAAQAARTPDAIAVEQDERRLTYAALWGRATALAERLRARGVGGGSRVVVLLPRSVELVVAELAVLQAGGAYVPLDAAVPAARLRAMVADSGARVGLRLARVARAAVGSDGALDPAFA